ncbi:MAG: hypothetical protein IAB19_07925 [Proteobacteria bacterium]|uniref:Uncharacterized protein n=1 Tax=Candidatus Avisuccinivibrio stercorigallinarum TaxID=2840704 RepID=A0A9D9GTT2_9GAMM|nr:hypothetical protein [Candidatus Avisuccinivibrio stercorigallinarum]
MSRSTSVSVSVKRRVFKAAAAGAVAGMALLFAGCSASTADIRVYLSDDLQAAYGEVPALEADVAGVTEVQQRQLASISAADYFRPGNALRRSLAPVTLHFGLQQQGPYLISGDDKAWELWESRGASFIAVLCNLPDLTERTSEQGAAPAGADPRILLINMDDGYLKDSSEHLVLISSGGVLKIKEPPEASAALQQADGQ